MNILAIMTKSIDLTELKDIDFAIENVRLFKVINEYGRVCSVHNFDCVNENGETHAKGVYMFLMKKPIK